MPAVSDDVIDEVNRRVAEADAADLAGRGKEGSMILDTNAVSALAVRDSTILRVVEGRTG
ncbi:MAG: hypothetical protein U1F87_09720 [Kiritimatiellia bacterium]